MRITKQNLEVHIYSDKARCTVWYKNGQRHREDGPASIWSDGDKYYYVNGKRYSRDNYWKEVHANY